MATSSPGSALSANCMATSDGSAPRAKKNVCRLPVQALSNRRKETCSNRLSDHVVTKGQPISVVDENVGVNQLRHRINELTQRKRRQGRNVMKRESSPETRSKRCCSLRC